MNERELDTLEAFQRVNNLARQAEAAGVKRFVFVSIVKIKGEVTMPSRPFRADDVPTTQESYGVSEYEAEVGLRQTAQATLKEVVIVRPPLAYDPMVKGDFTSLMWVLALGLPLPLGALNNLWSMVILIVFVGHLSEAPRCSWADLFSVSL
jgi:nucleoside-diphosphate-sugar epimerase